MKCSIVYPDAGDASPHFPGIYRYYGPMTPRLMTAIRPMGLFRKDRIFLLRTCLAIGLFLLLGFTGKAQLDTLPAPPVNVDSLTLVQSKRPRMALWLGLAVPGAGQVYNKRWWKVPLVYGAYGFAIYRIRETRDRYLEFDGYFKEALATNSKVEVVPDVFFDARQIKTYRDRFRDDKDRAVFLLIGIHFLSALEAFVDAHLKNFNIDDDLGVRLINPDLGGPAIGLRYRLH